MTFCLVYIHNGTWCGLETEAQLHVSHYRFSLQAHCFAWIFYDKIGVVDLLNNQWQTSECISGAKSDISVFRLNFLLSLYHKNMCFLLSVIPHYSLNYLSLCMNACVNLPAMIQDCLEYLSRSFYQLKHMFKFVSFNNTYSNCWLFPSNVCDSFCVLASLKYLDYSFWGSWYFNTVVSF